MLRTALIVLATGLAQATPTVALTITDPEQGPVTLGGPSGGGLSGITYHSGTQFLTVADSGGNLFEATIDIDPVTGTIVGTPTIASSIMLDDGVDLEAIAFDPTNDTVIVADESGPAIRQHDLTGNLLSAFSLPSVYNNSRSNKSLESVARHAGTGQIWTANEEALIGDGLESTFVTGTAVRFSNLVTGRQYAYLTDPIEGFPINFGPGIGTDRRGVVDLLVLPNRKMLILERELSGVGGRFSFARLLSSIYEVTIGSATDVSDLEHLDVDSDDDITDETWTPLEKNLLWDNTFVTENFEGLALGPQLDNGSHALVLISDDDGILSQSVLTLQLNGVIPEPSSLTLLGLCSLALLRRK